MAQHLRASAAVIVIAAIMGGIGWMLLAGGPVSQGFEARLTYGVLAAIVMAASVSLWTILAALLGPRRLAVWAAVGLVSPLLGGLLLLPPVSYVVLRHAPVVTFGVGLATGVLVWAALRFDAPPEPLKAGTIWNDE